MAYWLFRLAAALVPRLPEPFGYWLFARLGDLGYLFAHGRRKAYLKNLKHVLGPQAPGGEMRRITRLAFENLLKNYFDLFRGPRLTPARLRAELAEVVGFEHLEAALAQGHGLVGGSAHFGNFNLFVHLTAVYLKDQHRIVVPVERLEPVRLFEAVQELRASQGIEIVPVDAAVRTLIKTLRAGGIVGLALDLDVTGTGLLVNLFGAPARLPDGVVALALKCQAPVVVAFIRRLDDNRCAVTIEPPLYFKSTRDLAADVRAGVEQTARLLEKWIRRYPEQWLMFQPIWEEDRNV